MTQALALVSVVVGDYDEALAFYVGTLGFELVEDTPVPEQGKRWVVVRPPGARDGGILLARAANDEQRARVGFRDLYGNLWDLVQPNRMTAF